jgi:hypothetical protein
VFFNAEDAEDAEVRRERKNKLPIYARDDSYWFIDQGDRESPAVIGLLKKGADPLRHGELSGENTLARRVCPLFQRAVMVCMPSPSRTHTLSALRFLCVLRVLCVEKK